MKKGLEGLIHQTKKLLATSLATLALYAPAQEAKKLEIANDSWNERVPVNLVYQTTLGLQEKGFEKNPNNLFKTEVYFSGAKDKFGPTEFSYFTTDLNNPQINAAVVDNSKTKLYFIGDSGVKAEVIYQEINIMNSKGEITTEYATPKEKACSLLMKLGLNLLETADEEIESCIKLKTGGIVNLGIKEALIDYCESQTRTIGEKARQMVNPELAISEIPLGVRDNNLAFRNKEVGRKISLRFYSQTRDTPNPQPIDTPITIFYHLSLKRNGDGNTFKVGSENEFGTIEAYTQQIRAEAKEIQLIAETPLSATTPLRQQTTQPTREAGMKPEISPFSGFWRCEENNTYMAISHSGKVFFIDPRQLKGEILTPVLDQIAPEEGIIFQHRIGKNLYFKTQHTTGNEKVELLNENTMRVENLRGNTPGKKEILKKLPEWDMGFSVMGESPEYQKEEETKPTIDSIISPSTKPINQFEGVWIAESDSAVADSRRILVTGNEVYKVLPLTAENGQRVFLRALDTDNQNRKIVYGLFVQPDCLTKPLIPMTDMQFISGNKLYFESIVGNLGSQLKGEWRKYKGLEEFNLEETDISGNPAKDGDGKNTILRPKDPRKNPIIRSTPREGPTAYDQMYKLFHKN